MSVYIFTYIGPEWNLRFGRNMIDKNQKITLCPSFEIESYLEHQGAMFAHKYDPNSLLYLSKAGDLFDVADGFQSTTEALSNIKCPVMIMGSKTDILYPVTQQRELANSIKASGNNSVTYFEMDSLYGKIQNVFYFNLKIFYLF
jgi:homoserine acetyltransferase